MGWKLLWICPNLQLVKIKLQSQKVVPLLHNWQTTAPWPPSPTKHPHQTRCGSIRKSIIIILSAVGDPGVGWWSTENISNIPPQIHSITKYTLSYLFHRFKFFNPFHPVLIFSVDYHRHLPTAASTHWWRSGISMGFLRPLLLICRAICSGGVIGFRQKLFCF